MDKKYIISADDNNMINWICVNTEEGPKIINITDRNDKEKYMQQLNKIDKEYGDFYQHLFGKKCHIINQNYNSEMQEQNKEVQENEQEDIEEKKVHIVVKTEPESEANHIKLKKRINSNNIKKIATLALAFIIGASASSVYSFAKEGNIVAKAKKVFGFQKQTTAQAETENEEVNLEAKSLDELIAMLNKGDQQEAFNKIIDVQDYFNEVAAPTVRQGDKQLYLTFDETVALYIYANSHAKSIEDFQKLFGKSKIVLLNPETQEYEEMTADTIAANYLSACLNLNYYYQLGATEPSGISKIFENKKEGKFFSQFESKLLEYNKTGSKKTANEINEQYVNAFMSGSIDSAIDKFPGASSLILTSEEPTVYLKGIISDKMHKTFTKINETLTCQKIFNERVQLIFKDCKLKENGKEDIIEEIARRQDETVIDLDRNIDLSESIKGYRESELNSEQIVTGYANGFGNGGTVTKRFRKVTKSRKEARKYVSEKQLKKAEKNANKKIDKMNKEENKRAKKLIKENEKNDKKEKERQKREYDEQHKNDKPKEVIVEETWTPEETPQQDQSESHQSHEEEIEIIEETYEDTTIHGEKPKSQESSSSESQSHVEVVEEFHEDTTIHGEKPKSQSASSSNSQSHVEVREETHEDTTIHGEKPKAQKVVKVERPEEPKKQKSESHEEEAETQETEDAKVRVRE